MDDATNFQRNYSIGEVEVEDGVIYHKTEYRERRDHFAYFACSEPLVGLTPNEKLFSVRTEVGIPLLQWQQARCQIRLRMVGSQWRGTQVKIQLEAG